MIKLNKKQKKNTNLDEERWTKLKTHVKKPLGWRVFLTSSSWSHPQWWFSPSPGIRDGPDLLWQTLQRSLLTGVKYNGFCYDMYILWKINCYFVLWWSKTVLVSNKYNAHSITFTLKTSNRVSVIKYVSFLLEVFPLTLFFSKMMKQYAS